MTDDRRPDDVPEEMAEYLSTFLDETDEQLESLVEALLVLEEDAQNTAALNDSFRLLHSIKGASGMMGLENITLLTHHLESHFELLRSGLRVLDRQTMNIVLRCIDFLRDCVERMRAGEALGAVGPLLEEVKALEKESDEPGEETTEDAAPQSVPLAAGEGQRHVVIVFESGLQLVDLKARLILSRLGKLGDVVATTPAQDDFDSLASSGRLELVLATEASAEEIREAADVDGVGAVTLDDDADEPTPAPEPTVDPEPDPDPEPEPEPASEPVQTEEAEPEPEPAPPPPQPADAAGEPARRKPATVETMRVDVERLDNLMNLAGELVVNRARFSQVAGNVSEVLGSRNAVSRARDFADTLRHTIAQLERSGNGNGEWRARIDELSDGIELLEEQSELWDTGRRSLGDIQESVDQLTRISDSLQRSVLGTRMVPVAPLFNRFRRVVRDLSTERGKQVNFEISGEKTELDKRMIDELSEPLVHLVRNSIDHGLESPEVRSQRGKPERGTIRLEARHSGNSVFIDVRDDGGGIDADRIRGKIHERGLLGSDACAQLTDEQALDYIWHPGFSTASEVTDISGRGVGMDAVKTRIRELNGTIELDTTPGEGTVFTIRLPLTLAIIHSLLIRVRGVCFSMPIEDVREIVAVAPGDVATVHGRETIDVRGEFLPLIEIDDVFEWNDIAAGVDAAPTTDTEDVDQVVILQSGGKLMGLRVEALLGSEDLVIKSLSQNFIHIRGLSGASILGDGTVCLMLDVSSVFDLAIRSASRTGEG